LYSVEKQRVNSAMPRTLQHAAPDRIAGLLISYGRLKWAY
jgi:hypothetical protein